MSYDFRAFRPKPGEDPLVTAESDAESEELAPIDPAKEASKRRVADALIAKNPTLEIFELDYEEIAKFEKISVEEARLRHRHLELNGPGEGGNGIQIALFDDEASISVPYWHSGDKANKTFQEIWEYLEIITRETGYLVYDPQFGRILNLSQDFAEVLSRYVGVVGHVQGKVPVSAEKAGKPWWKFW